MAHLLHLDLRGSGRRRDHRLPLIERDLTSDRFWMNLQSRYDLDIAIAQHHEEFDRIKPCRPPESTCKASAA